VRRFIYPSTSSVYGVSDAAEVTEEHPLVPITDYNEYKGLCEPIRAAVLAAAVTRLDACERDDVALDIALCAGASEGLVRPQLSADVGVPAILAPRNTTLDTSRLRDEMGSSAPDVWPAIDSSIILE
jgi:hypothetical protein